MNGIEQLCPNCGMCCDGTLFADVELRAGDDAKRLKRLGLLLHPKTKTRLAFSQPCAGFDGRLCRIYADRPKRCGLFECGVLKRVESGAMTANAALKTIAVARKRAAHIRELLAEIGGHDERQALTHRYTEVMSAPVDFSRPDIAEKRGELMLAMNDLMTGLQRDFLR